MTTAKTFYLIITCIIFTATCTASGDIDGKITVDGLEREYILHLPKNYDGGMVSRPLVLVLHGGGSNAGQMKNYSKFNKLADKENFIAVYPNAVNKNWSDGRFGKDLPVDRDDVKFISELLDTLSSSYKVDTKRVFATGISNGGFFSIYLAYKLSNKILAVAPVCASMAEDYADSFKTEFPVSVLMIDGTEDPLVKYEGGFVGFGDEGERGKSIAVDRAFKIWSGSNDCQNSIKIEEIDNNDGKDGCTAMKYTYYKCKDNTQVVLIKIEGGGHTWPGGSQYLPKIIVGKVCRDFDATEVIWEFFKKQETR